MLKLGRGSLTQGLVAVLCLVVITWLALVYFVPSPPSRVTIATGGKGTTFDYFGQRYRERFACRNPVARCQGDKLHGAANEERIVADEGGIGALAHKGCKGRIDLAGRRGEPLPKRWSEPIRSHLLNLGPA